MYYKLGGSFLPFGVVFTKLFKITQQIYFRKFDEIFQNSLYVPRVAGFHELYIRSYNKILLSRLKIPYKVKL